MNYHLKRAVIFTGLFSLLIFQLPIFGYTQWLKRTTKPKRYSDVEAEPTYFGTEPAPSVITSFIDTLRLTLYFDKVILGNSTVSINKKIDLAVNFETDYININDSVFIKIFIARGQEYGKKMYLWRWDYYKKVMSQYRPIGHNYYSELPFNNDHYWSVTDYGQGIGVTGSPDYLMIYYRFKAE